jgi:hypothetical protein
MQPPGVELVVEPGNVVRGVDLETAGVVLVVHWRLRKVGSFKMAQAGGACLGFGAGQQRGRRICGTGTGCCAGSPARHSSDALGMAVGRGGPRSRDSISDQERVGQAAPYSQAGTSGNHRRQGADVCPTLSMMTRPANAYGGKWNGAQARQGRAPDPRGSDRPRPATAGTEVCRSFNASAKTRFRGPSSGSPRRPALLGAHQEVRHENVTKPAQLPL